MFLFRHFKKPPSQKEVHDSTWRERACPQGISTYLFQFGCWGRGGTEKKIVFIEENFVLVQLMGGFFFLWLIGVFVFSVFEGAGSAEGRGQRVQIDRSGSCEAGFGWGKRECAQENWVHLGWIVCL